MMVGSRFMVAVAILLALTAIYYIYSFVHENQVMHYDLSVMDMKLRKASWFESKYKTCHTNEYSYEQTTRELKDSLTKKEAEFDDLRAKFQVGDTKLQLEERKLSEAFLFYTDIKQLFSVSDQFEDEFEKKVQGETVLNHVKGEIARWEADQKKYDLLKRNYTQLTNIYRKLKKSHKSLQKSNFRLQDTIVNNCSPVKKSHDNLPTGSKKLTKLYGRRPAINRKLVDNRNIFKEKKKRNSVDAGKKGKSSVHVVEKPSVEVVKKSLEVHGFAARLKNTIEDLGEEKHTMKVTENPKEINRPVESDVVIGNQSTNSPTLVKQGGKLENITLDNKHTDKSETMNANISSINQTRTSNLHKKGEHTAKVMTTISSQKKHTRAKKKSSKRSKKHRKPNVVASFHAENISKYKAKQTTPVTPVKRNHNTGTPVSSTVKDSRKIKKQTMQRRLRPVPTPAYNENSVEAMAEERGMEDEDVLDQNVLSQKAAAGEDNE